MNIYEQLSYIAKNRNCLHLDNLMAVISDYISLESIEIIFY